MKLKSLLILICGFFIIGCKNKFEDVTWNAQVLTPIASSKLTMQELTQDSSIVANSDNSISVVYNSDLYAVKPLDTLVTINVQPFSREITLESLELGRQDLYDTLTFVELLTPVFQAASDSTGISVETYFALLPLLTVTQGITYDIPSSDPIEVDISEFFRSAVLTQGYLDFTLDNGLQLDVNSVDIEIRNKINQVTIYSESFTDIKAGTSASRNIDLAAQMNGEAIEGELEALITNVILESPQDHTPNANDYIAFNLSISDVKVSSAEAIFPAQNVIDNSDTVGLQGLENGIELTKALLSNGFVDVKVRSTIPTELDMSYEIPSASDINGDTFRFNTISEAAPIGGSITLDSNFYFDGYWFDLTGSDGTLTNTFYNGITGKIEPTPEPIPLSLDDTLFVELAVKEMEASYVEGYMGSEIYTVGPEIEAIELPDALTEGGLTFEDVKMTVVFENSLGVPAEVSISELTGINTTNSSSANLTPLPEAFFIPAATKSGDDVVPSVSRFDIDNAVNIFNIHPDQIQYALDVQMNPNGVTYDNFAYIDSEIKVSLEIEVPLSVNANEFVLRDTIDFLEEAIDNPEQIKEGILSFIVYNGFPVDVDFDLYFLDESDIQIDSLVSDQNILAADVDTDGKVIEKKRSKIDFTVPNERIENILLSKKIILVAKMNTEDTDHVTFYDDYDLEFKLVGDFEYEVKGGTK